MAEAEAELREREQTSSEFVFGEIHRLGLENNVLELEEHGFTIVPDALPIDMVEHMREHPAEVREVSDVRVREPEAAEEVNGGVPEHEPLRRDRDGQK